MPPYLLILEIPKFINKIINILGNEVPCKIISRGNEKANMKVILWFTDCCNVRVEVDEVEGDEEDGVEEGEM